MKCMQKKIHQNQSKKIYFMLGGAAPPLTLPVRGGLRLFATHRGLRPHAPDAFGSNPSSPNSLRILRIKSTITQKRN